MYTSLQYTSQVYFSISQAFKRKFIGRMLYIRLYQGIYPGIYNVFCISSRKPSLFESSLNSHGDRKLESTLNVFQYLFKTFYCLVAHSLWTGLAVRKITKLSLPPPPQKKKERKNYNFSVSKILTYVLYIFLIYLPYEID